MSKPKRLFLKKNWIDLVAAIPFDLILPIFFNSVRIIRLIRILKIIRLSALFSKYFKTMNNFLKASNLDKILSGVFVTIIAFTLMFYYFGPSFGIFEDFYYVLVTLFTVGYGGVVPSTFPEKVLTIIMIFAGMFIFSTITAAISSYFINIYGSDDDEKIEGNFEFVKDKLSSIDESMDVIKKENEKLHRQNQELKSEIKELKEIIKKE